MRRTLGWAAASLFAVALLFVFMGGTSLLPGRGAAIETAKGVSPGQGKSPAKGANDAKLSNAKGRGPTGPVAVEVGQRGCR